MAAAALLALGAAHHARAQALDAPAAAPQDTPQPLADAAPAAPAAAASAQSVLITGRALPPLAAVAGFGGVPAARAPLQTTTLSTAALADAGAGTLGQITRLDASLGDAYNAPGYWASMRVRGYALDNRFNYRRDGLPISGETALALENKERLEVLKGISGIQAGTSSPGGLVNLVVKRPGGGNASAFIVDADGWGRVKAAADIDRRLGPGGSSGLRVNLAAEHLQWAQHDSAGSRWLAAIAGQTHLGGDLLEAELEASHQSQPSVPGLSLLGNTLPDAATIDARINLNNQPWSQPVVFDGTTASLRWTHPLTGDWRLIAHAATQQLRTNDRLAFAYGCSAENAWSHYCSDGTFDLYDFRSEGERRATAAAALSAEGSLDAAAARHHLALGLTASRYRARMGPQTNQFVGTGRIDGQTVVTGNPAPNDVNTNRTENQVETSLRDRMVFGPASLWLGLRQTWLNRDSARTDGSQPIAYAQNLTTPWLAAAWQISPADMLYASWGQAMESEVVANRARYTNAGQALPALKSQQSEIGFKHDDAGLSLNLALFDIRRPQTADFGPCDDTAGSCTRRLDGAARHQGLQASADWRGYWRAAAWSVKASAMWLRARREGSATAAINGLTPENVAQRALRIQLGYQAAALPGLNLQAHLSHEGPRYVLPDNSLAMPGWTTLGLAARYNFTADGRQWTLRAGIDNLTNRRAWQESPYQYGHVYLYPLAPRTLRGALEVNL